MTTFHFEGIDMTTRKINGPSKQEVLQIVKLNPTLTTTELVQKFGIDRGRAYHARSELGVAKKRLNPKRVSGLKTVRTSTLDAKDKRIAELEKELADWLDEFEKEKQKLWETTERRFENLVGKLHEELMQAKAVIAYLEKKVANGTSI